MNLRIEEPAFTLSRRLFLGALSAGTLAALAGCETSSAPEATNTPVIEGPVAFSPVTPENGAGGEVESLPPPPPAPVRAYRPPVDMKSVNQNPASGIIPRSVWALGGPNYGSIEAMGGIHWITFHHSGDPPPFYETDFWKTAEHLEGVRAYHRRRGFNDIGYHFAIDRMGRVWQLRSLKYQGQHVRTNKSTGVVWNRHNIGVVVLGNFEKQSMTPAQKSKVITFAKLLRTEYGLPASKIKTHQELVSTECPGRMMQPFMVSIRARGLV